MKYEDMQPHMWGLAFRHQSDLIWSLSRHHPRPVAQAAGNVTMFEGDPTPPGCPHDYFTFVNNFGAHNNQLVTLLNAFAVAKNISRTLVIPPFIQVLWPMCDVTSLDIVKIPICSDGRPWHAM